MSLLTLPPKKLKEAVKRVLTAGLVPMIEGSPGIGKSDIVRAIAKDWGLKVIDTRLSQAAPEDLNGLPMRKGDKAAFLPFENFPVEGDKVPEGYNGWLIFLDELTSAPKSVQAAAYKLILDRAVGIHNLHENVAIVAAGNKMTDRAVVVSQSTALQSRLIHLELIINHEDWYEWAYANGIDSRVIGYLSYKKNDLYVFKPDHTDKTFRCPRTWHFASDLIKGRTDLDEIDRATIAGAVTEAGAVPFISFTELGHKVPKIEDILSDPEETEVPLESSHRFFTISSIIDHVDDKNLDKFITYANRFPEEFQVIFLRGVTHRKPELRKHKSYSAMAIKVLRFANQDDEDYAPIR